MRPFFAHSAIGGMDGWQHLADHLRGVADRARRYAEDACPHSKAPARAAAAAGLLHDLGKYRPGFQNYIRDLPTPRDDRLHKEAGAAKAAALKLAPVAFAVFGHHGGMPDRADLEAGIRNPAGIAVAEFWHDAVRDCPELAGVGPVEMGLRDPSYADLFTRLVFSCLVDADWADTHEYELEARGTPGEPEPPPLDAAERLKRVLSYIGQRAESCRESVVKNARADVLDACLDAAGGPPGLYSLTVPTGGGKTLAALAFALKHAATHCLRRVIYVAPYTTILEQNADVVRAALGLAPNCPELLEHHGLAEPAQGDRADEMEREAAARRAENWDAPIIVTTNVQFFESLFSHKPGRCRKLHNIARSVVILDECQTLPPGLVAPTCGMLKQLTSDLGCTAVLCTATQPAFDHDTLKENERLRAEEIIPRELCQRDERDLFNRLQRVRVTWPKADEFLDWSDVATAMRAEPSALCVVNTKRAARAVYDELIKVGADGVFHLSTGMCPQHRREKLAEVKRRLDARVPCYLVSTQLIEAGVDVDFPFLMRELAPLESIIQAAGRCNREGRLPNAGGRVQVFRSLAFQREPKKFYPPDRWYVAGRQTLETCFLARGVEPQIDDPGTIRKYFSRLYHTGILDVPGIQAMRQKFQFATVAKEYRLIEDDTEAVVIENWTARRRQIADLLDQLQSRPSKRLFRQLTRFQVNIFRSEMPKLAAYLRNGPRELWVWSGRYDESTGLAAEFPDAFVV